jgi:hypothetical protein
MFQRIIFLSTATVIILVSSDVKLADYIESLCPFLSSITREPDFESQIFA